jgi:hypothetical protein
MPQAHTAELIGKIADGAKNIAIIVGVVVTIFGLYKGYKELALSARSQKLSSFGTVKELIKVDEEERAKINEIVAMKALIPDMIKKHGDASSFYHSPEATKIASVGRHYEELGAMVRLGYVDFDLIYEIIPFPDEFWEATEPIRKEARSNWSEGHGLPDFWKNFEYLKSLYDGRRDVDSKAASR